MKSLWEGNADTEYRIWKGPGDLSAEIRLMREGDQVRITARVTDDIHTEGDALEVTIDGVKRTFKSSRTEGATALYDLSVPLSAADAVWEIRVLEDDGEGLDGWAATGAFKLP